MTAAITRTKPLSPLRLALVETVRALDACPYTDTDDLRDYGAVFLNRFLTHLITYWDCSWSARGSVVRDIAEVSSREAAEIVGEPRGRSATLEETIAFELSETMVRTEASSLHADRPVQASQVVSEREARRTRELTALAFRRWKMRAA